MTKVYWDTNLFIYLFEDNPVFAESVVALRQAMLKRGDLLLTGSITVGEILTKPASLGNSGMIARYRSFFTNQNLITVVPFDLQAAEHYAEIRCDKTIGHADAIQLSCAATAKADLFVTNDHRLRGKVIPGLRFLCSLDSVPL